MNFLPNPGQVLLVTAGSAGRVETIFLRPCKGPTHIKSQSSRPDRASNESHYPTPPRLVALFVTQVFCRVARFLLTRGNHLPNFAFLKMTSPFFGLKNNQKHQILTKKRSKETKFTKKIYQKNQNQTKTINQNQTKTIKVVKKPNLQILVWKKPIWQLWFSGVTVYWYD